MLNRFSFGDTCIPGCSFLEPSAGSFLIFLGWGGGGFEVLSKELSFAGRLKRADLSRGQTSLSSDPESCPSNCAEVIARDTGCSLVSLRFLTRLLGHRRASL